MIKDVESSDPANNGYTAKQQDNNRPTKKTVRALRLGHTSSCAPEQLDHLRRLRHAHPSRALADDIRPDLGAKQRRCDSEMVSADHHLHDAGRYGIVLRLDHTPDAKHDRGYASGLDEFERLYDFDGRWKQRLF